MSNSKSSPDIEQAMAEALESVERIERETSGGSHDGEVETEVEEPENAAAPVAAPVSGEVAEDVAAVKEQLLRLAADFENFRKRTRREKEELRKFASESVLYDFLPVIDNLQRALAAAPEGDPIAQGVEMVSKQFTDVLATHGVRAIDSVGQPFDPERHEAMGQAPSSDVPPGNVVEELEKGYMIHDRLLRAAKVIVATAQDTEGTAGGEG